MDMILYELRIWFFIMLPPLCLWALYMICLGTKWVITGRLDMDEGIIERFIQRLFIALLMLMGFALIGIALMNLFSFFPFDNNNVSVITTIGLVFWGIVCCHNAGKIFDEIFWGS